MFPRLLQSLALAAGIGLLLAACGPGAHTSPEAAPDAPAPSPGEERIIEEDLTR